ncbi:hypothetical protein DV515_00010208 [Chloebia gouldiae]|uniref:Uncharacterized protein n=1 Tax=Chloebia gouldiae TaxID=44316 RepID=A0A3L8S9V9_CHLGU|nr:hypothetical protein DV515_00010208 [Chloebia gouldiae]
MDGPSHPALQSPHGTPHVHSPASPRRLPEESTLILRKYTVGKTAFKKDFKRILLLELLDIKPPSGGGGHQSTCPPRSPRDTGTLPGSSPVGAGHAGKGPAGALRLPSTAAAGGCGQDGGRARPGTSPARSPPTR